MGRQLRSSFRAPWICRLIRQGLLQCCSRVCEGCAAASCYTVLDTGVEVRAKLGRAASDVHGCSCSASAEQPSASLQGTGFWRLEPEAQTPNTAAALMAYTLHARTTCPAAS